MPNMPFSQSGIKKAGAMEAPASFINRSAFFENVGDGLLALGADSFFLGVETFEDATLTCLHTCTQLNDISLALAGYIIESGYGMLQFSRSGVQGVLALA